jgi:hypothetical protein
MEILQERERNASARFRPIVVRELAIYAHTQNLGVTGLEIFLESFQARYLLGSGRCPIEWIEHQHNVFFTFELVQREFGSAQMALQFEVRRMFADFNHDRSPLQKIRAPDGRFRK